jgi:hypothetical protein
MPKRESACPGRTGFLFTQVRVATDPRPLKCKRVCNALPHELRWKRGPVVACPVERDLLRSRSTRNAIIVGADPAAPIDEGTIISARTKWRQLQGPATLDHGFNQCRTGRISLIRFSSFRTILSTSALKFSSAQWSSTIGTSRSSISAHNCRDILSVRRAGRSAAQIGRPLTVTKPPASWIPS